LADRRDPIPLEWPDWKNRKLDDVWKWDLRSDDFDRVLGIRQEWLIVGGHWTSIAQSREEVVSISSALVSRDKASALLRAMQTAEDVHDIHLPSFGDEANIDHPNYVLRGWIDDHTIEGELDTQDPWAGNISYPGLAPAQFICDLLCLTSNRDERFWSHKEDQAAVGQIWSLVWGLDDSDGYYPKPECGRRLQASPSFIQKILQTTGMSLIVKVVIEHRVLRGRYDKAGGEEYSYVPPYFRIYVFDQDGSCRTL
jgi:hypothetical protein